MTARDERPAMPKLHGQSMFYGRVGDVYVCLHPATPPSKADWDDWMVDMEREAPTVRGLLVWTEGGGPDAGQRKRTAEMWNRMKKMPPIAIVTGAAVVRTMITALNFFMSRPMKGFAPTEIDRAL